MCSGVSDKTWEKQATHPGWSGDQQGREMVKVPGRRPKAEPDLPKRVCVTF